MSFVVNMREYRHLWRSCRTRICGTGCLQ